MKSMDPVIECLSKPDMTHDHYNDTQASKNIYVFNAVVFFHYRCLQSNTHIYSLHSGLTVLIISRRSGNSIIKNKRPTSRILSLDLRRFVCVFISDGNENKGFAVVQPTATDSPPDCRI
jgi:hypothetical protein